MKRKFIIDENIIYHAARGINKHDEESFDALYFLKELTKNCHKIILEKQLIEKYMKILSVLKEEANVYPIPHVDVFFKDILYNKEKWEQVTEEISTIEDNKNIPAEDQFLIEIGHHLSIPIITNDYNLIEDINNAPDLEITILNPVEALDLVVISEEE